MSESKSSVTDSGVDVDLEGEFPLEITGIPISVEPIRDDATEPEDPEEPEVLSAAARGPKFVVKVKRGGTFKVAVGLNKKGSNPKGGIEVSFSDSVCGRLEDDNGVEVMPSIFIRYNTQTSIMTESIPANASPGDVVVKVRRARETDSGYEVLPDGKRRCRVASLKIVP